MRAGSNEHRTGESPRGSTLPVLSLLALALLLALAPYAMSLEPDPGIYENGVAHTDPRADPLHVTRIWLVLAGLGATGLAIVELGRSLRDRKFDLFDRAGHCAVVMAVFVIGWRSFPYWANGVYRVCERGRFTYEFDPKHLMPMVWLGELWRAPVMLVSVGGIVIFPGLLACGALAIVRKRFVSALITFAAVGVAAAAIFGYSPEYLTWLMD